MIFKSTLCKLFGHTWTPIYIGGTWPDDSKFNFVAVVCERCRFGKDDLLDFVRSLEHDYATYSKGYWAGEKDINCLDK